MFPSLTTPRRALAAAVCALSAAALVPAVSSAGTYQHLALGYYGQNNAEGISMSFDAQGHGYLSTAMSTAPGASYARGIWNVSGGASTTYAPENTIIQYSAPVDTSLSAITWTEQLHGGFGGDTNWIVRDSSTTLYAFVPATDGDWVHSAAASGSYVQFLMQCGGPSSCYASTANGYAGVTNLDVTLTDSYSPTVTGTVTGGLSSDAKLTGTEHLTIPAADRGAGLYKVLIYDGSTQVSSSVVDSNGGKCADITGGLVFGARVPCLLSATADGSVDTTALADGNHTLKAYIMDASGNQTLAWGPTSKLVANHPPVNTAAPALGTTSSAPVVGTAVSADRGTWTGPSLSYAYAWQQCDAAGANCAQIPGATTLSYTPTSSDIGKRLRLAVTATNPADSVTTYSPTTGAVQSQTSSDGGLTTKPGDGSNGSNGTNGANGGGGANGVTTPSLPSSSTTTITTHTVIGRVAGEAPGVACPQDKATLVFEHVKGGQTRMGYGRSGTAQVELTCTTTGKAIAGAKLEIATKTGSQAAVASDVTTDGAGHATLRLAKGASRGITVGYRMYTDDPIARATATLKVLVNGKITLKANHKRLRNGQTVTLSGTLAGGEIPKRGVALTMQWRDGKRWRSFSVPFKTNRAGKFHYAYRFTRSSRTVSYQLRVLVNSGQVDYPYMAVASKPVTVTVGH